MAEPAFKTRCVERFLRYVTFDTQSEEESKTYPSTEKQLVLLRHLVDELNALKLEDVEMDEHGYVTATIPATTAKGDVPVIGFLAHVDTSPEMSGANVKPIIHENYQGQDVVLPDDPEQVIRFAENPHLKEQIGNDIITASGTTLLGADNKASPSSARSTPTPLTGRPSARSKWRRSRPIRLP
jgi:tripeptide aminopeptidase